MRYTVLMIVVALTACGGAGDASDASWQIPTEVTGQMGAVRLRWDPSDPAEARSIRSVIVYHWPTESQWNIWPEPWIQPGETRYVGDLPVADFYNVNITLEDGFSGLGGLYKSVGFGLLGTTWKIHGLIDQNAKAGYGVPAHVGR